MITESTSSQHQGHWQWVLLLLWILLFFVPGWIFFSERGGLSFLAGTDFKTANRLLFPLVGLYAFFLIWTQLMIGSNIRPLEKVIPWAIRFHRVEGVFVLLFALLHPTMLFLSLGVAKYFQYKFVDSSLLFFVWLGYFQLFLIIITAGTALLRKRPFLKRHWRKVHIANYVVFVSVWVHSWFLGTDVQSTSLRYLWIFFATTFVVSVLGRIWRALRAPKRQTLRTQATPPTIPGQPWTPPGSPPSTKSGS